ncbi:MAG: M20/M25/M40 family metallo-hydrolase [Oscillospiraceae bacterium]|nr:M20/M25/M40 family metallo-hydrolase [Oscillospiraceae bacterium]
MVLLVVILLLLLCLLVRTYLYTKNGRKLDPELSAKDEYVPDQEMLDEVNDHFRGALRIPSISHNDPSETDWSQFQKLHDYLKETYPSVFQTMELELVGGYSMFLRWKGTDSQRRPIAFLSHLDVVPVEPLSEWTYPPFSATVADGYIWGRGTLDMRCQLITVLESCERLIKAGFTPEEDIYLLFGCNEEVGDLPPGIGADRLSEMLKERNIKLDCVIDEGGAITDGSALGVGTRVCAVGVSEKGFASFDICATDEGGHSSRPPAHTALGRVCSAAVKIENNWMKPRLTKPVEKMLDMAAPYMDNFALRLLMANKWLFRPLLPLIFSKVEVLKPFVQTTTALTMASASEQDNVLPQEAHIVMNSRVLPGETIDDVKRHLEELSSEDNVTIKLFKGNDPSGISPSDTVSFAKIDELVQKYYPGTLVVPYIQLGASDSTNYYKVCDNVYRIMPFYFPYWVTNMGHRADERVPVEALERGVKLFMDFIREYKGEG